VSGNFVIFINTTGHTCIIYMSFLLGIIGGDYDVFPQLPGGFMRPRFDPPGPGRFGGFPGPRFGGSGSGFGGIGGGFGGFL
jgi:hypothetical protein